MQSGFIAASRFRATSATPSPASKVRSDIFPSILKFVIDRFCHASSDYWPRAGYKFMILFGPGVVLAME
jgi:hypothetical protein